MSVNYLRLRNSKSLANGFLNIVFIFKMKDQYTTIAHDTTGEFKDRGSKFFAYAYAVYSNDDIKSKLEIVKKLHPKARHHCFSWRLGTDGMQYRANDDGEPSGTAGRPILGQIDSFGLTNVLVIVVRYFGGTKLGVPGLINAYKRATIDAFEQAETIEKTVDNIYQLTFGYEIMSDVMNFVKKAKLNVIRQEFEVAGLIEFALRQSETEAMLEQIKKIEGLKCTFLKTR